MKLCTDLNRWDVWSAKAILYFRPSFTFLVSLVIALALPLVNSPQLLSAGGIGFVVFLAMVALSFLLITAFTLAFVGIELLFASAAKRGILGTHELRITSDGLVEETRFNTTIYPWPTVDRILLRGGLTLVRAGAGWHIIPKRALRTQPGAEAFMSELRERMGHET